MLAFVRLDWQIQGMSIVAFTSRIEHIYDVPIASIAVAVTNTITAPNYNNK